MTTVLIPQQQLGHLDLATPEMTDTVTCSLTPNCDRIQSPTSTMKKPALDQVSSSCCGTSTTTNNSKDLATMSTAAAVTPPQQRRVIFPSLYRGRSSSCSSSSTVTSERSSSLNLSNSDCKKRGTGHNENHGNSSSTTTTTAPTTPSPTTLEKRIQWLDLAEQEQEVVNQKAAAAKASASEWHAPQHHNALLPLTPLVFPKSPGLKPRSVRNTPESSDFLEQLDHLPQLPAGVSLTPRSHRKKRGSARSTMHQQQPQHHLLELDETQEANHEEAQPQTLDDATSSIPRYRKGQRMILPAASPGGASPLVSNASSHLKTTSLEFLLPPPLTTESTATTPSLKPAAPMMEATSATTETTTENQQRTPRRLRSILRTSSNYEPPPRVSKIPSVESDIPSLASTASQESFLEDSWRSSSHGSSHGSSSGFLFCLPRPFLYRSSSVASSPGLSPSPPHHGLVSRTQSAPVAGRSPTVGFDPRVWVREFQRSQSEQVTTWYTSKDLERFKLEAVQRIIQYNNETTASTQETAATTMTEGRKAMFSHCALQAGSVKDDDVANTSTRTTASGSSSLSTRRRQALRAIIIMEEIRKVLMIADPDTRSKEDNDDTSLLDDYSNRLKSVLPHVQVVKVRSYKEAIQRVQDTRFDVILTEEQQQQQQQQSPRGASQPTGGSIVLRHLRAHFDVDDKSLFVGVSDSAQQGAAAAEERLVKAGADLCWTTAPSSSDAMVDGMLQKLLVKRGRNDVARELAL